MGAYVWFIYIPFITELRSPNGSASAHSARFSNTLIDVMCRAACLSKPVFITATTYCTFTRPTRACSMPVTKPTCLVT